MRRKHYLMTFAFMLIAAAFNISEGLCQDYVKIKELHLKTSWEQMRPYTYHFDINEGEWALCNNGPDSAGEEFYVGCTAIAVGQLINYYFQNGYQDGWLDVLLENVTVYPRFTIGDNDPIKKECQHSGYETKNSYEDSLPDDTQPGAELQEYKDLREFLWTVAIGLDANFKSQTPDGSGTGVRAYENEEPYSDVDDPRDKIQSLLIDRFRFNPNLSHTDKFSSIDKDRNYIVDSIDKENPVLMSIYGVYSSGENEGENAGHTVIIYGYRIHEDDSIEFKINFGWGHSYNDWYPGNGPFDAPSDGVPSHSIRWEEFYIYRDTYPNVEPSSGYASVSEDISISPLPVILNQDFTVSFTLRELNGFSKNFEELGIAILDDGGNLAFDFAKFSNEIIVADGTLTKSASNQIYDSHPPGTYQVIIRGRESGGDWFDFDTTGNGVNPKSFTVIGEPVVEDTPGSITADPSGGNWNDSPHWINVSCPNAERIYCAVRTSSDGSTPEDPPEPTIESHDVFNENLDEFIGSSGQFQVWGEPGMDKLIKVRFRGYNASGYGPTSDVFTFRIDLADEDSEYSDNVVTSNIDTALIIDYSGSMKWNDPLDHRLEAARFFIDRSQPDDYTAIVGFCGDAYINFEKGTLRQTEGNQNVLKEAVNELGELGPGTNISVGLRAGYDQLSSSQKDNQKIAILLTDGQNTSGQKIAYEEYKINGWKIFTIGLSDDADETLLQEIAAATGGEYFKVSTDDAARNAITEIYKSIHRAVHKSEQTIHEESISIFPDELVERYFDVPPGTESLSVDRIIPGSDVEMSLVQPDGRVIDRSTQDSDVYHALGATYEIYRITNPMPGQWKTILRGTDVPPEGEPTTLSIGVTGDTATETESDDGYPPCFISSAEAPKRMPYIFGYVLLIAIFLSKIVRCRRD